MPFFFPENLDERKQQRKRLLTSCIRTSHITNKKNTHAYGQFTTSMKLHWQWLAKNDLKKRSPFQPCQLFDLPFELKDGKATVLLHTKWTPKIVVSLSNFDGFLIFRSVNVCHFCCVWRELLLVRDLVVSFLFCFYPFFVADNNKQRAFSANDWRRRTFWGKNFCSIVTSYLTKWKSQEEIHRILQFFSKETHTHKLATLWALVDDGSQICSIHFQFLNIRKFLSERKIILKFGWDRRCQIILLSFVNVFFFNYYSFFFEIFYAPQIIVESDKFDVEKLIFFSS